MKLSISSLFEAGTAILIIDGLGTFAICIVLGVYRADVSLEAEWLFVAYLIPGCIGIFVVT